MGFLNDVPLRLRNSLSCNLRQTQAEAFCCITASKRINVVILWRLIIFIAVLLVVDSTASCGIVIY